MEKRLNYFQVHKNKKPKKIPFVMSSKIFRELYSQFLKDVELWRSSKV